MNAVINIAVALLILVDSFVLPPKEYEETVANKTLEQGTGRRNKRYMEWFVISGEGNKYGVPGVTYSKLNPGDTFTVLRTGVFDRPLQISYTFNSDADTYQPGNFYIDTGVVRGSYIGTGAIFLILIISVWLLFFHQMIKQPDDVKLRILLIASFMNVPLLYFYFIAQP